MHAACDAPQPLILADPREAADATGLITDFGKAAEAEAVRRSMRSRDVGNVVHFCRWRRIGRLVGLMQGIQGPATHH